MWVKDVNHFCSHSKSRHDASNEHALDWLLAFVFVSKDVFQSADSIKAPLKDKDKSHLWANMFAADWTSDPNILCVHDK